MLKIENADVYGFKAAIRGMRNPKNSWENSDSEFTDYFFESPNIGEKDLKLMTTLVKAGTDHSKFMRMINVTLDITAPLYWWKEYDTYKVGTVADSCSTMHKISAKEFEPMDFSNEHLTVLSQSMLEETIGILNHYRDVFNETKDKEAWWQMIQLLPTCYNQKRTVQLNYSVLRNMYHARKNHKLDEWREFCAWIERLPYSELITDGEE